MSDRLTTPRLFALRGATTVKANEADLIVEATEELLVEVLKRNDLAPGRARQLHLHDAPTT